MPPDLAKKHGLNLPPYPGSDCVVEIVQPTESDDAAKTSDKENKEDEPEKKPDDDNPF